MVQLKEKDKFLEIYNIPDWTGRNEKYEQINKQYWN